MTVLAFGCSVTHGTEIVDLGNSKKNIPFSYPALVAKHLGVECINFAFCGNSNENIFHESLDTISNCEYITAVIVGWTSTEREVWKCDGRTWQFIPSWCGTAKNVWRPYGYVTPGSKITPQKCADEEEYLEVLDGIYNTLIKYRFDSAEYSKKQTNYISALRAYCQQHDIRLIETCWKEPIDGAINIGKIGTWYPSPDSRHPTAAEHQLFAERIIKEYNL